MHIMTVMCATLTLMYRVSPDRSSVTFTTDDTPDTLPVPSVPRAGQVAVLDTSEDLRHLAGAWLAAFPSPHTRAAYRRDLQAFESFVTDHGGGLLAATRPVLDLWARHLEALNLSPATRARRLAAVSSFYRYAVSAGVLQASPAVYVRRPVVPTDSPRTGLTVAQAQALIAEAECGTPADRALVALCLGAGLRVSEALAVTPADITDDRGHRVVIVAGKGGRVRRVPLSPRVQDLLASALEGCAPTVPVIALPDRFAALRRIETLGRQAGITHRLRPHDLRHTAATLALDAGAPVHRVQDLLGHASPTTTQRYVAARERLDGSAVYVLADALAGAR